MGSALMPFAGGRYRFTRSMVEGAPADPGVYALWENDELIYYGRAAGNVIRVVVEEEMTVEDDDDASKKGWGP